MTKWEDFEIEHKIIEVLSIPKLDNKHHFGRSFLTHYQIAIELTEKHPELCNQLGMELGGRGTGLQNSLTQYIAQQLSTRIKNGYIKNIEGVFISNMHLSDFVFADLSGQDIHSTKTDYGPISLFRMKETK